MAFRIDEKEQEILAGHGNSRISHPAKLAYLLGIRPHMDYETGIAGTKRRISYQSLQEVVEYEPGQGSNNAPYRPSREALRAILRELERAGLIRWIKRPERGLFFECLCAHRGSPSKNRNNPSATPEQPLSHPKKHNPSERVAEPTENKGCNGVALPDEQPQEQQQALGLCFEKHNIPPVSGIPEEKKEQPDTVFLLEKEVPKKAAPDPKWTANVGMLKEALKGRRP